jgi:hypothetical protein
MVLSEQRIENYIYTCRKEENSFKERGVTMRER